MCLRKIYESIEFVHYIFVMRSGRLYAWQNIKLTSGRNHKDSFLFPAFSLNLSILCSIFPTAWSQFCPSSSTFLGKLYTHCYTSSRAVTWESQGLADQWWEWGPFLSHWQEERSSERRVCFHWGEVDLELPLTVSGSTELCTDRLPQSLECCLWKDTGCTTLEHISLGIFISRGHRRKRSFEY